MYTSALSTLMHTLVKRNDLADSQPCDKPAVKVDRKMWARISRFMSAERSDRREQYGAPTGLFILGYGKLPGPQESPRRF